MSSNTPTIYGPLRYGSSEVWIEEMMKRALIHALDSGAPKASQAELSSSAILSLIQSVGDPLKTTKVVSENTAITPTGAILSIRVAPSLTRSELQPIMDIQIYQCVDSDTALERMKDYLRSLQPDLFLDSIQSSRDILGNYALQTPSSILWVRDSIFVSIDSGTASLSFGDGTGGAPTVRPIAQTIDQYIAMHTKASSLQPKPNPVPSPTFPKTIAAGQQVVLKLDNVSGTHVIKRARVKNPELAFQVTNGTEDGQYAMFAIKPGSTSIEFTLAHAKILSIRSIDIPITIVA